MRIIPGDLRETEQLHILVTMHMQDKLTDVIPDLDSDYLMLPRIKQQIKVLKTMQDDAARISDGWKTYPLNTWGGEVHDFKRRFTVNTYFRHEKLYAVSTDGQHICIDSSIDILKENYRALKTSTDKEQLWIEIEQLYGLDWLP